MVNELIAISIMAFALGMDAFSLGIGMGMGGLRYRHIFNIGVTNGVFHVIMPLLGIAVGKFLSNHFGTIALLIGGILLLVLGFQMLLSPFSKNEGDTRNFQPIGWGLILFSLSVSLDSFSVGLSLGMIGAKTIITVLSIGLFSMVLSWVGLLLGKKVKGYIGMYGELLGGSILIAFGIKLLLPI